MRLFLILVYFFLLLFCSTSFALARDISISVNKNALFGDEEIVITASASGFTTGEQIHIKSAFFQDGTSNYFGFTKNNNDWIKNGASSESQRSVKIGEWDLGLIAKNDASDTGYKGNGNYKLKVGFYYITSGGNASAVNWSTNSVDIALSYPSPTLTPNPTLTSPPTSTPTPIPSKAPTPTLLPTKLVIKVSPKKINEEKKKDVLGVQEEIEAVTPTIMEPGSSSQVFVMPPFFLLIGIVIIITGCGILLFREWKKQKELDI